MDKLMREFGKSLQKELITKLITASQDAFDKDTFFTEDNLTAIFDSSCSEMKKSTKKAAKKSKKKKDPSQPSRTNTWMVYSNEQRPIVKAANPNAKFQDIGKMISTQWKALSDEQKQVYKNKANEINEANGFTVVAAPKTPKKTPKKKTAKKKTPSAPKKKKTDPSVQNAGSDLDDLVDELDELVEEYED